MQELSEFLKETNPDLLFFLTNVFKIAGTALNQKIPYWLYNLESRLLNLIIIGQNEDGTPTELETALSVLKNQASFDDTVDFKEASSGSGVDR